MELRKISDSKDGRSQWVVISDCNCPSAKGRSTTVHGTREDVEKRFPELKQTEGE